MQGSGEEGGPWPRARALPTGPRGRRAFLLQAGGSTGAEIQMSPGLPQAAYDLGLGHLTPVPSWLRLAQGEGRQTEAGGLLGLSLLAGSPQVKETRDQHPREALEPPRCPPSKPFEAGKSWLF